MALLINLLITRVNFSGTCRTVLDAGKQDRNTASKYFVSLTGDGASEIGNCTKKKAAGILSSIKVPPRVIESCGAKSLVIWA